MTLRLELIINYSVVMQQFIQIIEFNTILYRLNFWFLLQFLTFFDQMLKRLLFYLERDSQLLIKQFVFNIFFI
jgi:hypothetical protein